MTNQEAMRIIRKVIGSFPVDNHVKEALRMAYRSLAKDVPIKAFQPIDEEHIRYGMGHEYHDYYCPICNAFLAFETEGNIKTGIQPCYNCGQKIDWGE